MKVALLGSHGTGKTTAAYDIVAILRKQGVNAELLKEVARECPHHLPINEDRTREAEEWIMYKQYLYELELEPKCDILVCDRSLLDGYAYYITKFGKSNSMESFLEEKMKGYSKLFFLPVCQFGHYLERDGVRSIKKNFQKEIDHCIQSLIGIFDLKISEYSAPDIASKIISNEYNENHKDTKVRHESLLPAYDLKEEHL